MTPELEIGIRLAILRSCLMLRGKTISSASICIHQPQRSITRHAEEFGTLAMRVALTPALCYGNEAPNNIEINQEFVYLYLVSMVTLEDKQVRLI